MKVRAIEENAGVLNESRRHLTVFLNLRRAVFALSLELPLVIGQSLRGFFDATSVLVVTEVRTVTAASLNELGTRFGEDSLTTVAKDAGPIALEECHIEHPGALVFVVGETYPLVGVVWNGGHA